jgi:drug/metabolite transporter (DMT)-like permease
MIAFLIAQVAWAYAQVITKKAKGVNSIQINIHLGIYILLSAGLMYPQFVDNPLPPTTIITGIFLGGLPMAISQIIFIGATTITKNTGVLTMFMFVGVIVAYIVSVVRYNEQINPVCFVGSILIVTGLSKVVLKDKV